MHSNTLVDVKLKNIPFSSRCNITRQNVSMTLLFIVLELESLAHDESFFTHGVGNKNRDRMHILIP